MYTALPHTEDNHAQEEADKLQSELEKSGQALQLPSWGKIWVRSGKVIWTIPSHPLEDFFAPPLSFVDETLDEKLNIFAIGALIFRAPNAAVAALRHIQNLVVLAELHKEFWPPNLPPPRLHLRELTHPAAKLKTAWRHIPRPHIEMLFRTFIPTIREQAGLKLISPISLNDMRRAIRKVFPNQPETQYNQLAIQLSAQLLHALLEGSNLSIEQLELVVDYNRTPILVGEVKRQATLHFRDCLLRANEKNPLKAQLIWKADARYSSKFPEGFSLSMLEQCGCDARTLVEVIGLQFIDIYLGLWRTVRAQGKPYFGISQEDLGLQVVTTTTWAH